MHGYWKLYKIFITFQYMCMNALFKGSESFGRENSHHFNLGRIHTAGLGRGAFPVYGHAKRILYVHVNKKALKFQPF